MAGLSLRAEEAKKLLERRVREDIALKQSIIGDECLMQAAAVAAEMSTALERGRKVIFFGNGGSSMDAGHLAAELLGRFYLDRAPLPSVCLSDCTAAMTAIGNDFGYEHVFSRQLRAIGEPGDVAVGLTTSGNSVNVVQALRVARELDVFAIVLTGRDGGQAAEVADLCVRVPTGDTPRIQEACMHLGHTICEFVEAFLERGSGPGVGTAQTQGPVGAETAPA